MINKMKHNNTVILMTATRPISHEPNTDQFIHAPLRDSERRDARIVAACSEILSSRGRVVVPPGLASAEGWNRIRTHTYVLALHCICIGIGIGIGILGCM